MASLFRPAAIDAQRRRMFGAVTLHQPVRLAAFTVAATAAGLAAFGFLAGGSYARKETVRGWIAPEAGLAQVHAVRGGTAEAVLVRQGDEVKAGDPLVRLALDLSGPDGAVAPVQRAQARARIAELDLQAAASASRWSAEGSRLSDRADAARADAARLAEARRLIDSQLLLAERAERQGAELAARGFLAQPEVDRRAQAALTLRGQRAELDRQIAGAEAAVADLEAQRAALGPAAAGEASQLRAARSQLESGLAELSVQDGYVLRAPVSGRIAAVNIRAGEAAGGNAPLVAIAPAGSPLEAQLLAPTRAAGFVAEGQRVRLMVDAFPFQQFGVVEGTVREVSRAALRPDEVRAPVAPQEPVYRVAVTLDAASVAAYGADRPLQPGMTLSADVLTARRTFLQWLTDPLLAARARAAG